ALKKPGPLISLSTKSVNYRARVVQMTNGEVTVPVKKKNFPVAQLVSLMPSAIHVKYQIPLIEYKDIHDTQPSKPFVTFNQLVNDSTGFLKPHVQQVSEKNHLKIISVQPQEISYFIIVDSDNNK